MIVRSVASCFGKNVRFYWVKPCTQYGSMEYGHQQNCNLPDFAYSFAVVYVRSLGASKSLIQLIEAPIYPYYYGSCSFMVVAAVTYYSYYFELPLEVSLGSSSNFDLLLVVD